LNLNFPGTKNERAVKNAWLETYSIVDHPYPYSEKFVVLRAGFPQEVGQFLATL
jgi:hypothetical protein